MRADVFIFSNGLAKSRTHAAALIAEGVEISGKRIEKASQNVPDKTPVEQIKIINPSKYVSRGGYKLEEAIKSFSIDVKDMTALDLGASTGGFTDCLLQYGAKKVYAADVGHGQLDASLAADPRVVSLEKLNAKTISKTMFDEKIDVITCDLSFISQKLVYRSVADTLDDGGIFVSLVKPQFEAGRKNLNKNGIVKDRKVHEEVIETLFAEATIFGLYPHGITVSPIEGGDGNREYLAYFIKNNKNSVSASEIAKAAGLRR